MFDVLQTPSHALAIVGAGPRGTSVLERICASVPELAPGVRLIVHVVDPYRPGAGRVWRTGQPEDLLMNTVASQVTVFTDKSVDCEGPIRPGPSLYEWASDRPEERLGPDAYPTRACYGRYLEWAFRRTVRGAPEHVTVEVHQARAIRLEDNPVAISVTRARAGFRGGAVSGPRTGSRTGAAARGEVTGGGPRLQTLTLDDGTVITGLSAVILVQGHVPVAPTRPERTLARHADRYRLRYVPPANPADVDLSTVAPGEPVLLRGLGLCFFDHMALLTLGRGGSFKPGAGGGLVYRPSGKEPKLYAGSRRGVPYQARGDNAKGTSGRHRPLLLTPEVIAAFRARADGGDPADFRKEIWPLVRKEVEAVYYQAVLLARHGPDHQRDRFLRGFLTAPAGSGQETAVLELAGLSAADHWSWRRISFPYDGARFQDPAGHRDWLLSHLRDDAEQAALGNVAGPVKAALDVLRDIRNELRQIVDHAGLSGDSRRDQLDGWYTPLNAFLSIGPPRERIEQMTALIEAGVLDVIGPRLTVRTRPGAFVADSPDIPGSSVRVTALVEARLPEPDLARSRDPLLSWLLTTGRCNPHTVSGYTTGGLDVTRRPYHLINHQGEPHQGRFAFGVPTEGVHWVTAAGARPGVGSVMLSDADAVARAALRTVPGPAENGTAVVARPLGRPAGLRDKDLCRPSTTATA